MLISNCNLECYFLKTKSKGSHLSGGDGDWQRGEGLNHSLDGTDGKGYDWYNYSSVTASLCDRGRQEEDENLRSIGTTAITTELAE